MLEFGFVSLGLHCFLRFSYAGLSVVLGLGVVRLALLSLCNTTCCSCRLTSCTVATNKVLHGESSKRLAPPRNTIDKPGRTFHGTGGQSGTRPYLYGRTCPAAAASGGVVGAAEAEGTGG